MRSLLTDLRLAVRVLTRAPLLALAVVAVLALGIGANVAILSLLNAVLFPRMTHFALSPASFYDWQRDARPFEALALYRGRELTLTGGGEPRAIVGSRCWPA